MRIDGGDCWLSVEPLIVTIAKEYPLQLTDYCGGYSTARCLTLFNEQASLLLVPCPIISDRSSLLIAILSKSLPFAVSNFAVIPILPTVTIVRAAHRP